MIEVITEIIKCTKDIEYIKVTWSAEVMSGTELMNHTKIMGCNEIRRCTKVMHSSISR